MAPVGRENRAKHLVLYHILQLFWPISCIVNFLNYFVKSRSVGHRPITDTAISSFDIVVGIILRSVFCVPKGADTHSFALNVLRLLLRDREQ